MKTQIAKALEKAAITIAAAVTSGALVYACNGDAAHAAALVGLTATVMGFLAFCATADT